MQCAIGMEPGALFLDRHMGVNRAFEIFLLKLAEAIFDVVAQGITYVEVFSGNLDLHVCGKIPISPLS